MASAEVLQKGYALESDLEINFGVYRSDSRGSYVDEINLCYDRADRTIGSIELFYNNAGDEFAGSYEVNRNCFTDDDPATWFRNDYWGKTIWEASGCFTKFEDSWHLQDDLPLAMSFLVEDSSGDTASWNSFFT